MIISRPTTWTVAFKTKNTELNAGKEITIEDIVINGPGEYDVAGISVQGLKTPEQTIYVVHVEDLRVCIVPSVPQELSGAILEQIGSIDIAVVPLVSSHAATETFALINLLEPQVVIIIGDGDTSSIHTSEAGAQTSVKVTKSSLPTEERNIIVLKAEQS